MLSIVAHITNPNTGEGRVGWSLWLEALPGLHRERDTIQGSIGKICDKTRDRNTHIHSLSHTVWYYNIVLNRKNGEYLDEVFQIMFIGPFTFKSSCL